MENIEGNILDESNEYCTICEKIIDEDEPELIYHGEQICEECATNLYKCDECEHYFSDGEFKLYNNGECYCYECEERNTPDYDFNGNSDYWRDE